MRRILVLAVVAAVTGVAAPNAEAVTETDTGSYVGGLGMVCDRGTGAGIGGACFDVSSSQPTEFVTAEATDDSGRPVGVAIRAYNAYGYLLTDTPVECGSVTISSTASYPHKLHPGVTEVRVRVRSGLLPCGPEGAPAATTGTVTLTWD